MLANNTHKFVIDSAGDKIGFLSNQLKDLKGSDPEKAKMIQDQIADVFLFLESYVEDMKSYKTKLDQDIQAADSLVETKLRTLSADVDNVEERIKATPEFSDKEALNDIYDSLQAGEKAKDIKNSIDIHIKDAESFIENKKKAVIKMNETSSLEQVMEKAMSADPDMLMVGQGSATCDIEMDSLEFSDFVFYLKSNNLGISDIDGETDDGQRLYINSNDKIRPPLDVIVDKNLSLNITGGSIKSVSEETGNTVWRDIEDYVDDFMGLNQTTRKPWNQNLTSKEFADFLEFLAVEDINVVSIRGAADDDTQLWVDNGSIPYTQHIVEDELAVYIENGTVEKNGIYYDMEKYFNIFNKENGGSSDVEEKDTFLQNMMDVDSIPDVKDEKFFSKLRLQGKLFADMIQKIDDNNFSFYMLDAVIQGNDGEVKIQINKENVLCPSEEYIREEANHVVVNNNKSAVKTNTGEMIGLMEALVLLD
jgi:hypothetical protein